MVISSLDSFLARSRSPTGIASNVFAAICAKEIHVPAAGAIVTGISVCAAGVTRVPLYLQARCMLAAWDVAAPTESVIQGVKCKPCP